MILIPRFGDDCWALAGVAMAAIAAAIKVVLSNKTAASIDKGCAARCEL
jgi:hypothetical protein